MKKGSTIFLRIALILLALGVLAICIFVLPVGFQTDLVGYKPVIVAFYIAAIPFFIALYQAWKLLSHIDKNNAFSHQAVQALKYIKYCALVISGIYIISMPYIFVIADMDDAPGVVAMGLVIIFASLVIATFAGVLQKLLQNMIEIKAENELTV